MIFIFNTTTLRKRQFYPFCGPTMTSAMCSFNFGASRFGVTLHLLQIFTIVLNPAWYILANSLFKSILLKASLLFQWEQTRRPWPAARQKCPWYNRRQQHLAPAPRSFLFFFLLFSPPQHVCTLLRRFVLSLDLVLSQFICAKAYNRLIWRGKAACHLRFTHTI